MTGSRNKLAILVLLFFVGYPILVSAQSAILIDNQKLVPCIIPKLYHTFEKSDLEDAKKLIHNLDVNQNSSCLSLLSYTIISGANNPSDVVIDKIKLLIEAGADVNAEQAGKTPLLYAIAVPIYCQKYRENILKEESEKIKKGTGFCLYAGKPYSEISSEEMEVILKDINILFDNLQKAQDFYITEVLKLLVENGADINRKYSNTYTAVQYAAFVPSGTSLAPLKFLIKQGANINLQVPNGNTLLHVASLLENQEVINLLLRAGADSTIRNINGHTYQEMDFERVKWKKEMEQFEQIL